MDYQNHSVVYPGSVFHVSHASVAAPQVPTTITAGFDHSQQSPRYQQQQHFLTACSTASTTHHPFHQQQQFLQHQPSYSTTTAIYPSPPIHHTATNSSDSIMMHGSQHAPPPLLMASSSSTTTASSISSSSAEFLNEAFAKATSIPESFYPEFLQYSKESYEQSKGMNNNLGTRKKRGLTDKEQSENIQEKPKQQRKALHENSNSNGSASDDIESEDNEDNNSTHGSKPLTSSEIRRQIHIQSEQKRRAQIKDGFEELRNELPACLNKKMSKVALLHKTVQHIQHLKNTQMSILSELERLVHENEQLRKFQESVLQREALENLYTMSSNNSM
ncbi:hypothetical protein BDF20DRAFT_835760 [Mycotypha africana]|uniref:uncharacterized protein n=1 Tax=Mycotypha africana TaxID=64632 RepID=UPI0023012D8D|nr:uncharacterized protein BDF20DRAFT_835760 [Mycotypha africana]KAI8979792.1 hypothetical protein BDF20DRAFT_835760 [Mycotypha africana]